MNIRCERHGTLPARRVAGIDDDEVCVCPRCFDEAVEDLTAAFAEHDAERADPTAHRPQGGQLVEG